jgi:hypothetical protein
VTPTTPPQLSGHIGYYTGGGPVPGVDVQLISSNPGTGVTDSAGNYGFSNAGVGNVAVRPAKQGNFDTAITSLDATLILQAIVEITTLTPEQRLAGDVTGNGTISSLDATRILQFQAGIITKFDAATACGSDWLFKPVPSPTPGQILTQPSVVLGVCQPGQISLTGFTPPVTGRDFQAILLGDVTGNWTP